MTAIETLKAYRTLKNADNVDDAIEEIKHQYDEIQRLKWRIGEFEDALRSVSKFLNEVLKNS